MMNELAGLLGMIYGRQPQAMTGGLLGQMPSAAQQVMPPQMQQMPEMPQEQWPGGQMSPLGLRASPLGADPRALNRPNIFQGVIG